MYRALIFWSTRSQKSEHDEVSKLRKMRVSLPSGTTKCEDILTFSPSLDWLQLRFWRTDAGRGFQCGHRFGQCRAAFRGLLTSRMSHRNALYQGYYLFGDLTSNCFVAKHAKIMIGALIGKRFASDVSCAHFLEHALPKK
jgi:hypothetical protein